MHEEWYPGYPSRTHLFNNKERLHTQSVEEALGYLTAPLPYGNYATMIVSTGGHWRTTLFKGYADGEKQGGGIDGVVAFYEHVARRWVREVQERLSRETRNGDEREGESMVVIGGGSRRITKNVVIRPYLPGHDQCREAKGVLEEVELMEYERYNWRHIWKFNHIFETLLTDRQAYPNIHYLPIDRPGRLRPDAHTAKDCLHVMAGADVLEGWTRYIWHFVTQELGARA
ncbi:hypothetical protein FA13DRAFT_791309 [Coprinellus micaceus]|uniref:Uncharacterized protein n=1 Tax=Coprinellus micaceus TaxID=71717 RepID=A0A4Y7T376_COPMI|nr:hypothetical protein FA13DRAFT_791309 [Coprinellus micaceus]